LVVVEFLFDGNVEDSDEQIGSTIISQSGILVNIRVSLSLQILQLLKFSQVQQNHFEYVLQIKFLKMKNQEKIAPIKPINVVGI